jgi:ribosome-binding protein aMBF1 (putative translation factor)
MDERQMVFMDMARRFPGGVVNWGTVIGGLADAGISGAELAAGLGVARSTVDNWKRGHGEPSYSVGAKLLAWWDRSKKATAAREVLRARATAERVGH